MARKRQRNALPPVNEINVTPLMDLTFLLLIVFMITAPVLEYGIDVSPPKLNAADLGPQSIIVTLTSQGAVLVSDEEVSLSRLADRLQQLNRQYPERHVLVRADGARPYREVIDVMKAVRGAGIENVMLVTEAEDNS